MNIHFRLDDRHKASRKNLRGHLELLIDDGLYTVAAGLLDDGAHFCSEDALGLGLVEQRRQPWHGLHYLDAVLLIRKALVHFQKRDNALQVPKIIPGRLSVDVPIHRSLEEDRSENPIAVKARAGDDTRAHLMHERKHLLLVGPRAFLDSVGSQCFGRAATTLVQRGKKAALRPDFPLLLFLQARSIHAVLLISL